MDAGVSVFSEIFRRLEAIEERLSRLEGSKEEEQEGGHKLRKMVPDRDPHPFSVFPMYQYPNIRFVYRAEKHPILETVANQLGALIIRTLRDARKSTYSEELNIVLVFHSSARITDLSLPAFMELKGKRILVFVFPSHVAVNMPVSARYNNYPGFSPIVFLYLNNAQTGLDQVNPEYPKIVNAIL